MAAGNLSLIELPIVNLEGIVIKLPLPSLLACCAASKSLLNLIKEDSDFARLHLAKSEPHLMIQSSCIRLIDLDTDAATRVEVKPNLTTPLDGFQITHSCNGLVLLEHMAELDNVHRSMIYNPVTGEYTLLPELVSLYRAVESGFFFCPKTNRFDVMCAFYPVDPIPDVSSCSSMDFYLISDSDSDMELDVVSDHDIIAEGSYLDIGSEDQSPSSDSESDYDYSETDAVVEIFAKGYRSWQSLGVLPFSPLAIYSPCQLEKVVHWLCLDEDVPNLIVFFNFKTYEFGEISGPAHVPRDRAIRTSMETSDLALVVVGNRLSIFDSFSEWSKVSVWVMKEYGVENSWSREYVLNDSARALHIEHDFRPLLCRNNGELVMVTDHGYILFYDLNKKEGRVISHPPLELVCRALIHTPSFISLRDVVSGSRLEVVNVAPRLADPGLIENNYLEVSTTDLDSL